MVEETPNATLLDKLATDLALVLSRKEAHLAVIHDTLEEIEQRENVSSSENPDILNNHSGRNANIATLKAQINNAFDDANDIASKLQQADTEGRDIALRIMRLYDQADRQIVSINADGEATYKPDNIMKGFLNTLTANAVAIQPDVAGYLAGEAKNTPPHMTAEQGSIVVSNLTRIYKAAYYDNNQIVSDAAIQLTTLMRNAMYGHEGDVFGEMIRNHKMDATYTRSEEYDFMHQQLANASKQAMEVVTTDNLEQQLAALLNTIFDEANKERPSPATETDMRSSLRRQTADVTKVLGAVFPKIAEHGNTATKLHAERGQAQYHEGGIA